MTNNGFLFGYALATIDKMGNMLDAYFPEVTLGDEKYAQTMQISANNALANGDIPDNLAAFAGEIPEREVRREVLFCVADISAPPLSVADVYLRLHGLSVCLTKPNAVNLDNIFSILNNVVWTNFGPCSVEGFENVRLKLQQKFGAPPAVLLIDKIPRMVDYVVPKGVRIANADRVRLGAHLAPGTTVMHEGFCNYNAGTLGTSMIEGRISQGVIVGEGSDIGGGASIMGTLSGGGQHKVSIGERSLLGANSGLGISLGNDCIVEAGLYITAGTKVLLEGDIFKARDLNGANGLLFLRNSITGQIEAKKRKINEVGIKLNASLHKQ